MAPMHEPIRVLIVDDSVVVRRAVSDAISEDPDIAVVGTASNGNIALQRISQLNPEVLVLDIEMPESDGFDVLRALRSNYPSIRTIMFSSMTQRGALQTIEALSLGASDYVAKPTIIGRQGYRETVRRVAAELIPKIKQFRPGNSGRRSAISDTIGLHYPITYRRPPSSSVPKIVAIGVSTGGPEALSRLLSRLLKTFPIPIVIVQHMPSFFTKLLAERLDSISGIKVIEGSEGIALEPGVAYIAPGDFHMTVKQDGGRVLLSLNQEPPENSCRPAADVLFRSVAKVYGPNALGVIMTGMGQDGCQGLREMKKHGAMVFAQDQVSSVVWGMPSLVIHEGLADCVIPLDQMSVVIEKCVEGVNYIW